jgi:MSHA biogenesis protein MshL
MRSLWLAAAAWLPVALAGAAEVAPEKRFDVEVTGAPAPAFFRGLAEGSPYNLAVHPDVAGSITLKLSSVTVPETLAIVRDTYGYDFRPMATGYLVLPATAQLRMFQVNYLDLQRSGVSRTRVSSGQLTQGRRGSDGGGGDDIVGDDGGEGRGPESSGHSQELTGTSIATRSRADFWVELEASLKAIVGAAPDRSVVVHPASGVIAVRATPRELSDVDRYLKSVQTTMTRQVVLEAKIVEVELSDGFQAGVNWATVLRSNRGTYSGGVTGPPTFSGNPLADSPIGTVPLTPGTPPGPISAPSFGGAFTLALDFPDFSAFIELLGTQGRTRVLSSPRVATLNNQKAVIKAGSDEFFVTDISSNTVTGTAAATNRDVELTPFFSGIALDVTPQVAEDGSVILHIHPTVSEVTDQVKSLTVAGVTDQIPLAFSEVRESDSIVKAKSGQVIVIGGLMRNQRRDTDYKTPLLGDIPLVGNLFKSQRRTERKTELVILLKPVVVDSDEQWQPLVDEPLARARGLDPKSTVGLP